MSSHSSVCLDSRPGSICGEQAKNGCYICDRHGQYFLSPSAISSLLASVTLDLSQYALDIVKGLAGERPDPSPAPRMAPWVLVVLVPVTVKTGKGTAQVRKRLYPKRHLHSFFPEILCEN